MGSRRAARSLATGLRVCSRRARACGRRLIKSPAKKGNRRSHGQLEPLLPDEGAAMTEARRGPAGGRRLKALLWKSWLTQRRKPLWTLAELAVPVVLTAVLAMVHRAVREQRLPDTVYQPFAVHGDMRDLLAEYVDGRPMISPSFAPTELYLAPRTAVTEVIARKLVAKLKLAPNWAPANPCNEWTRDYDWTPPQFEITATAFANATELEQKLFEKLKSYSSSFYAGIVFDESFANGKDTKRVTYTLRFPFEQRNIRPEFMQGSVVYTWATNNFGVNDYQAIHRHANASDGGLPGYWREGFLTLQRALDTVLTETLEPGSLCFMSMMDVQLTRYPFTAYVSHPLIDQFPVIMPSVMVVSFVLSVLYIVRSLTIDKENHLVEYIEVVTGLSAWLQWSAHFLVNVLKLALVSAAMTAALCTTLLSSSHPALIFAFVFSFSLNAMAFSFLVSAFFNSANNATLFAGVLWFLLYVPCLYAQRFYTELSRNDKMYFSLLAHGAAVIGCQIIGNMEEKGSGLNWRSVLQRPSGSGVAPYEMLLFMFLDALPLFLLAICVNAVKSSRRPWCQCLGASKVAPKQASPSSFDSPFVERASPDERPSVIIDNVVKKYRDHNGRDVMALDRFSFFVQPGELTVVLGHNGAGKSTLMRVLTGCLRPTSGSVYINGKDAWREMDSIRSVLGYCPQYNALCDCMTVHEHLQFYAMLKGAEEASSRRQEKTDKITRLLMKLRLDKNKNTLARNLSGGQKRRLSLAIALVGDPQVILMDEPTSGMDPGAKGDIIDVLKSIKRPGATMVLVTHYVDEAELLGDRVAILSDGRLRCYGTNMFLKNRLGNGYRLTLAFRPVKPGERLRISVAASRAQDAIDDTCSGCCRLLKTKADEATFLLHGGPDAVETCRRHQLVLYALESMADQLGIRSMAVSMPSMQDVFMNCSTIDDKNGREEDGRRLELPLTTSRTVTGVSLFKQQLAASLKKRLLYSCRQKRLLFIQFAVLALSVGMGAVLNSFLSRHSPRTPAVELDAGAYGPSLVPLALSFLNDSSNPPDGLAVRIADRLVDTFRNSVFVGSTVEELPSGADVSQWLLEGGRGREESFTRSHLFAVEVSQRTYHINDSSVRLFLLGGYFNPRAAHGVGAITNAMGNAVLKHFCPECRIRTVNHPLPQTTVLYYSFGDDFVVVLCLLVGLSFFCTSFAVPLVEERAGGAKHQQLLAGLALGPFWLANCLWDALLYGCACGLVLLIWWLGGSPLLADPLRFGHVCLILSAYGLAVLPLTYALSLVLRTPASAMTALTSINLLSGLTPTIAVAMLIHASFSQPDLKDIERTISNVCLSILPQFALARSLMAYYNNIVMREQCEAMNMCDWLGQSQDVYFRVTDDPLEWDLPGVGRLLLCLLLQSVALFCVLFLAEWLSLRPAGWWRRRSPLEGPRARTEGGALLEVADLTVRYDKLAGKLPAVNSVSFQVAKGEIFGLNGENGSGKTSTYKVLVGLLASSAGEVTLNGKSVLNSWREAGKYIGYCPQFDALLERLTGCELLTHFARIRGLKGEETRSVVDGLLDALGMARQANRLVKCYSGGNRRKMSLAVALLGAPSLLLLDEPTCGVDPEARRAIWKMLKYMKQRLGSAILLTSHDMEECEALCDRMGILVKGCLACVDRPSAIAEAYGCHYALRLTVENSCDLDDVEEAVLAVLPNAQLKAKPNSCQAHFAVPKAGRVTWSRLYRIVERLAARWPLSDFAISSASLQEAFVAVARGETTMIPRDACDTAM